jgi:lipopolysaccharide export system permease protein
MLIANLIPHYLNLALPGAFLISMILTTDRLSRSGEIVALMAAGLSLHRIVRPFLIFAVFLALVSLLISGFLQPISRYSYRELVHNLNHRSIVSVFQERKFVQYDNKIIWTQSVGAKGYKLGPTFILETAPNGRKSFLSSKAGTFNEMNNGMWAITLLDGRGASYTPTDPPNRYERIDFDKVLWPALSNVDQYRPRGDDERELLLTELLNTTKPGGHKGVNLAAATASFHDRTSRAALLLVMPLIAILLGLNLGRNPRSTGAVIGVLFLLGLQKALEYGLAKAITGAIPSWMGFWPLVGVVAFGAVIMFFLQAEGKHIGRRKGAPPSAAEPASPEARAAAQ